jgi:hypothetical protein
MCWHTRGDCFTDCKNKANHIPCSEIPADAKQGHLKWMQKCCCKKGIGSRPSGVQPDHPKPLWKHRKPTLPPVLLSEKLKPSSPCTLSKMVEGISIPWDGGGVIADKKAWRKLERTKKIRARSISTGMDHAFEILGEYLHNQPVCHLRESVGTCQSTITSRGNLCLPHSTKMDILPFQTRVNQPPGQPPALWNPIVDAGTNCLPPSSASNPFDNRGPGVDSVSPHVITTTALPALARQAMGVE